MSLLNCLDSEGRQICPKRLQSCQFDRNIIIKIHAIQSLIVFYVWHTICFYYVDG
jgi:hypothetical protein